MSIANKLTYLNTTKGKIKDSINLTGAGITNNDTFRSYAVKLRDGLLDIINNGTATLYNNFPKVSGTGSNISLTNTLEAPMFMNKFDGDTLQNGTPTPDSPLEIQCVEGIQNINVYGKNLFNPANNVWGKYNVWQNNAGNFTNAFTNTFNVKGGEVCSISFKNNSGTLRPSYQFIDDENNYLSGNYWSASVSERKYQNISIPPNATKVIICQLDGKQEDDIQIQFEYNSTSTTYQAYQTPQTYDVDLGNVKLYEDDYITGTPDNWSVVRNWKEVVFNGSEDFTLLSSTQVRTAIASDNISDIEAYTDRLDIPNLLSTYFTRINQDGSWAPGNISRRIQDNKIYFAVEPTYDVNSFKTWLSTHNTEVVYKLATPTTEQITDEYLISQLNALYNAKSKNGQTNISVDGQLPMIIEVSAIKDEI